MPIDEGLRVQIETYLSRLDGLIRRGRKLREILAADGASASVIADTRAWQEDCGITVNELSGSSKAHWLARSFSEAFLMRSPSGHAVEGAAPAEIVQRLVDVLEQAVASLTGMDDDRDHSTAFSEAPPPRRFDFVHNPELRPIVERAYTESQRALEQQDYHMALLTACGVLEAIVTDALERKGLSALAAAGAPAGTIADWSFETRCARLPAVARAYRDLTVSNGERRLKATVSDRDARLAGQVLRVVMRDLDPGR